MGQARREVRLLGAAEALMEVSNRVFYPDARLIFEQGVASARSQLSEEAFEKAWAEGRAMSMKQAIEYALDSGAEDEHG